jgi:hypothetical protein
MKPLLPLKHIILCSNQRTSGYRGLFSQGIRQPECEVDRFPRAGADVSFLINLLTEIGLSPDGSTHLHTNNT